VEEIVPSQTVQGDSLGLRYALTAIVDTTPMSLFVNNIAQVYDHAYWRRLLLFRS